MESAASAPEWIDDRYRVDGVLGRGGTSTVYRVWDARAERGCALKSLKLEQSRHRQQLTAQFQREYATLGQLAHPSIISVYDFGISGAAHYYTMELLEGGDLRRRAPLSWRSACRVLREVASALALLHSRRLIHRDVTAGNVHFVEGGRAKLMDFGAMTDMGLASQVVGTAPYIAPEAMRGQPLDGRVDLFALGALAYFALTGRNAYPAASLTQLAAHWRSAPPEPSIVARDVPPELDRLVMSLLSLDARVRPSSAAEVIERLTAIGDLGRGGLQEVAQAYLATPPLIGRERELQALRGLLSAAARGEGGAVLIESAAGMGKSRLLDTCALEARLAGTLVLRANGERAQGEDLDLLRALAGALLEAAPEVALTTGRPYARVLGHVLPELHRALGSPELSPLDPQKQLHTHVQAAASAWLGAVAREQRLAIVVDDVQEADAPSLLVLVELAQAAGTHELAIAAALRAGSEVRSAPVLALLQRACTRIELAPLDEHDAERLLGSLFGDVKNVKLVAHWAHGLSRGSPQALMDLAEHLVDSGHARYDNGSWALPSDLGEQSLPRSLTDAYAARVRALSAGARTLAEVLSLAAPQAPLDVAAYPELLAPESPLRVYAALDELVARHVLVARGDGHVFVHRALTGALAADIPETRARQLRRAIAAIEQRRGQPFMAVHYLQQVDDDAAALELMLAHVETGEADRNRSFWLTSTGASVVARALQTAERSACPPHRLFGLRRVMLLAAAMVEVGGKGDAIVDALLAQLRSDSGLDLYDPADPDPGQFLNRCLPRAQQRYDALPPDARGLSPLPAIAELAHVIAALASAYGRRIDLDGLRRLLAMLAPLRTLAPVVELLHDITAAAVDRVRGRCISDPVRGLLQRLEASVPGLTEVLRDGAQRTLTYYLALEQAQLCSPHVARYADYIAEDPVHEPLAWHLRMVNHLYSGEAEQARHCRDRAELLALRQPDGVSQLATSILYETEAHLMHDDLLALKAALPQLERQAELGSGWRGFLTTVRGEYEMLRGRCERACEAFEVVLSVAAPGEHAAWSRTMTSYVEATLRLGNHDRAVELAQDACEQSAALRLNPLYQVLMRAAMAHALAARGDADRAHAQMQLALGEAQSLGMGGVPLGCLYETAARISAHAGDHGAFELNAEHARLLYTSAGNQQLMGKYQRLVAEGRRDRNRPTARPPRRS